MMKRVCKIRCYPNHNQVTKINQILSACRFVQNKYIEFNIKSYEVDNKFISGYEFSKIINKLKKNDDKYMWLKECSSKAIKDAIMTEEKAFKTFFKKKGGFPKFKSRKRLNKESFFFIKDQIDFSNVSKWVIKIPILGNIYITEKYYLPDVESITSGRIIKDHNKYYLTFIYDIDYVTKIPKTDTKIGIDLGVKTYATIYTNFKKVYQIEHFKEYSKYKKCRDKIERLQKIKSKKVEVNYYRALNRYFDNHNGEEPNDEYKNIMKGECYNSSRIRILNHKITRLYDTMKNIKENFLNQLINFIVTIIKPCKINIEDLDVSDMISTKNKDGHHELHRMIGESCFYKFKMKLAYKCLLNNIKLNLVDNYYPSSKLCSCCGHKLNSLSLNDRIYICPECGFTEDRDINAAINILNISKKYCTNLV